MCRFLTYQSRVGELPLVQVSCFCEFPHHGLDLFAYGISPPSLQLDFRSLAQCFVVDLCICFHQLLDIGSMITIKVVLYLTKTSWFQQVWLIYCCSQCLCYWYYIQKVVSCSNVFKSYFPVSLQWGSVRRHYVVIFDPFGLEFCAWQ